ITGRRTRLPYRLPELGKQPLCRGSFESVHTKTAQGGDRPLPWRLELRRGGLPGLGAVNKCPVYHTKIALRVPKGCRQALHRRSGGIIGNEVACQLGGNVHGRRLCRGDITKNGQSLLFTFLCVGSTQNVTLSWLMPTGPEQKIAGITPIGSSNTKAGQRQREFGDISLTVTRTHTQCVQLHDFPRQVLIDAEAPPAPAVGGPYGSRRSGSGRLSLIQVDQHRRVALSRQQHVLEPTEHVGPHHLPLEGPRQQVDLGFLHRNRKVVGPEMYQPFDERSRGGERCAHAGVDFVAIDLSRPLPHLPACRHLLRLVRYPGSVSHACSIGAAQRRG